MLSDWWLYSSQWLVVSSRLAAPSPPDDKKHYRGAHPPHELVAGPKLFMGGRAAAYFRPGRDRDIRFDKIS